MLYRRLIEKSGGQSDESQTIKTWYSVRYLKLVLWQYIISIIIIISIPLHSVREDPPRLFLMLLYVDISSSVCIRLPLYLAVYLQYYMCCIDLFVHFFRLFT